MDGGRADNTRMAYCLPQSKRHALDIKGFVHLPNTQGVWKMAAHSSVPQSCYILPVASVNAMGSSSLNDFRKYPGKWPYQPESFRILA
jgi:hypothetical protein